MFSKLLCAAALTSAALAQSITIVQPASGTTLDAGQSTTVALESTPSSDITEVAIVIGSVPCPAGCPDPSQGLGSVLYSGSYNPQQTGGTGSAYANISVTIPNNADGPAQLTVASFSVKGVYATSELDFTTVSYTVTGASG